MIVHYVDTSALVRCYFPDEPGHDELRALVFADNVAVVTSELTRVELASAVAAAHRAGRVGDPSIVLDRFDADCAEDGPIALVVLDAAVVLPAARDLVIDHALRTLDALHLGVATTTVRALVEGDQSTNDEGTERDEVVLVTRDERQVTAALALGLTVR